MILKNILHSSMTLTLGDINSFIINLVTGKSSYLRSCLATEKHSSPYSKIGIHLQLINWVQSYQFFPNIINRSNGSSSEHYLHIRSEWPTWSTLPAARTSLYEPWKSLPALASRRHPATHRYTHINISHHTVTDTDNYHIAE